MKRAEKNSSLKNKIKKFTSLKKTSNLRKVHNKDSELVRTSANKLLATKAEAKIKNKSLQLP